jgi:hypothetical protein
MHGGQLPFLQAPTQAMAGNADRFVKKKMGNSPSFYFSTRVRTWCFGWI